jgi:hypothetical protein
MEIQGSTIAEPWSVRRRPASITAKRTRGLRKFQSIVRSHGASLTMVYTSPRLAT